MSSRKTAPSIAARASPETQAAALSHHLGLLERWNAKLNLVGPGTQTIWARRHTLDSLMVSRWVPTSGAVIDVGSGAGFPGIPIALMRPEIAVVLAESQNKKAAFLREAIRVLSLETKVHSARAEELKSRFDSVTLRAVDNMPAAVPAAIQLLNPTGILAILTTTDEAKALLQLASQSAHFAWPDPTPLPRATNRILLLGKRQNLPFNPY